MSRTTISIFAAGLALASLSANAAGMACSIHADPHAAESSLPALTKVTRAQAQRSALAAYGKHAPKVEQAELEVESGCLLYSFDLKVSGKSGIDEIQVDAGTGRIVSHTHETPAQHAAEAAADAKADAKSGH